MHSRTVVTIISLHTGLSLENPQVDYIFCVTFQHPEKWILCVADESHVSLFHLPTALTVKNYCYQRNSRLPFRRPQVLH